MIRFIPALSADAPLLSQLRQQCWAATYRGVYPNDMIDQFDYAWHTAVFALSAARTPAPRYRENGIHPND